MSELEIIFFPIIKHPSLVDVCTYSPIILRDFTWNFVKFGQKKLWSWGRLTKINLNIIFFGQNFHFVAALNRPPPLGVGVKVRAEPLGRQVPQLGTDHATCKKPRNSSYSLVTVVVTQILVNVQNQN